MEGDLAKALISFNDGYRSAALEGFVESEAVLGGVGGAALGILGGILGTRKERQEAHRRAAEQWSDLATIRSLGRRISNVNDPVMAARRAKAKASRAAAQINKRRAK